MGKTNLGLGRDFCFCSCFFVGKDILMYHWLTISQHTAAKLLKRAAAAADRHRDKESRERD